LSKKGNLVTKAKNDAKKNFEFQCIVCNATYLEGCHLFSAGPYPAFKAMKYNIVPLCSFHHSLMDNIKNSDGIMRERKPWARIRWILTFVM